MTALLVAHGLRKSYGATPALRGVSVAVDAGEVVAISGPSGSGKSTLLHCLAGILVPDAGEVGYAGRRLDTASDRERSELRRRDFGVLFQFGQLVAELSATENVALPLLLDGRRRREAVAEARDWLDRFGVGALAAARPGELSGGEQQRVALARALVTDPQVVFADEPTGALDTLTGERVLAALLDAVRASRATLLVVTHEARVAAHADREIVLRDGALDGTPEEAPGTAAYGTTGGAGAGAVNGAVDGAVAP